MNYPKLSFICHVCMAGVNIDFKPTASDDYKNDSRPPKSSEIEIQLRSVIRETCQNIQNPDPSQTDVQTIPPENNYNGLSAPAPPFVTPSSSSNCSGEIWEEGDPFPPLSQIRQQMEALADMSGATNIKNDNSNFSGHQSPAPPLMCVSCIKSLEAQMNEYIDLMNSEAAIFESSLESLRGEMGHNRQLKPSPPSDPPFEESKNIKKDLYSLSRTSVSRSSSSHLPPQSDYINNSRSNQNMINNSIINDDYSSDGYITSPPIQSKDNISINSSLLNKCDHRAPAPPSSRPRSAKQRAALAELKIYNQKIKIKGFRNQIRKYKSYEETLKSEYIHMGSDCLHREREASDLETKYRYNLRMYNYLRRVNVINDSFFIWSDGAFGTINGLRLGKLPTVPVSWEETNAGLGFVAHLLDVLVGQTYDLLKMMRERERGRIAGGAGVDDDIKSNYINLNKVNNIDFGSQTGNQLKSDGSNVQLFPSSAINGSGVTPPQGSGDIYINKSLNPPSVISSPLPSSPTRFSSSVPSSIEMCEYLSNYSLLPRGEVSVVMRKSDGSLFELYGSTGGVTRFFASRRFDQALVVVLGMVADLINIMRKVAPVRNLNPPFQISRDRVGGCCIRMQSTQDEIWTKALRCLLIDLKWMIGTLEEIGGRLTD